MCMLIGLAVTVYGLCETMHWTALILALQLSDLECARENSSAHRQVIPLLRAILQGIPGIHDATGIFTTVERH